MNLLWNEQERRLRAGWRLALHALVMVGLALVPIFTVAEPLTALHRKGRFLASLGPDAFDVVINMIVGPLMAAAVVASVVLAARRLDRRPLADYGLRFDRRWWTGLVLGLAAGALLMLGIFGVELAAGWVTVTGVLAAAAPAAVSAPLAFAFAGVKTICVGTYEEVVARGYWLRNLGDGLGPAAGILGSSAVFAFLHATNPNFTLVGGLVLTSIGVLFAVAATTTGRLSTAMGLHMAWNLFEGTVLGFPDSGDKERATVLAIAARGPRLLTGGDFGPEAGLLALAAALLGIYGFIALARRRAARVAAPPA